MHAEAARVGRSRLTHARAPGKVNLRLEVQGLRPDGYHQICSLATAVGVFDDLRFEIAPAGCCELTCNDPTLPLDESNLIVRAAGLLAERTDPDSGVRIELDKHIGIGAGLGGGSSDAATTLKALNRLWKTGVSEDRLAAWGGEIGSDVPLFFCLPTAVIGGRGERTRPVQMRWSGWLVLVFADVFVSTARVYRSWRPEDSRCGRGDEIEGMIDAASAEELSSFAVNDLEPAVFRLYPAVGKLRDRVRDLGWEARVSGAGSTLFVLFDEPAGAADAAARLRGAGLRCTSVGAGDQAMTTGNPEQPDDKR